MIYGDFGTSSGTGSTDWSSVLDSFVASYGKGLLAVMDYAGGIVPQQSFDNMNEVTAMDAIHFDSVDLAWGSAALDTDLACVPDVPPPN